MNKSITVRIIDAVLPVIFYGMIVSTILGLAYLELKTWFFVDW